MPALQTRVSRIRAVIPLKGPPSPRRRMRACYQGHLIVIIVCIFSCSH